MTAFRELGNKGGIWAKGERRGGEEGASSSSFFSFNGRIDIDSRGVPTHGTRLIEVFLEWEKERRSANEMGLCALLV